MLNVKEDLKTGQLKQIYLLCGEENYLIQQYRDKLIDAIVQDGNTMNLSRFRGSEADISEIIGVSQTLPFFAERRLIVVEDTGFLKQGGEALADCVREAPKSTYFIFAETEIDKRSRLYKAIAAEGYIAEMKIQPEKTLVKWIVSLFSKENKQISEWAVMSILEKTGPDMRSIRNEVEKIISYTLDRTSVTEQDVEAIVSPRVGNHIFDMIGAVASGRQKEALRLYYELLALREPPLRILYLLTKQLNTIMSVAELKAGNYSRAEIIQKTGTRDFLVDRFMKQASGFAPGRLQSAVTECVNAEEDIKSGRQGDRMALEVLLIRLSAR